MRLYNLYPATGFLILYSVWFFVRLQIYAVYRKGVHLTYRRFNIYYVITVCHVYLQR